MDLLESIKQKKTDKLKSNKKKVGFINVFVGEERLKTTMEMAKVSGFTFAAFIRSMLDVLIEQQKDKTK